MCRLFAHQPQCDYESQTRSLRIGGHCTSIRLELAFWETLEEIAAKEDMSLAKFLTKFHSEVLDHHGEDNNFEFLLRGCCHAGVSRKQRANGSRRRRIIVHRRRWLTSPLPAGERSICSWRCEASS